MHRAEGNTTRGPVAPAPISAAALDPLRVLIGYDFEGEESHVAAPNFYREVARQVLPGSGMEVFFPPILAREGLHRLLVAVGVSSRIAALVQYAVWLVRNRRRFDVVFAWVGNGVVAALLRAVFRWRSPSVCLVLYRWPSQRGIGGAVRRAILRIAARSAARIVALDSGQAASFARSVPVPDRCRALRYGVDSRWYGALSVALPRERGTRPTVFVPGSAYRDEAVLRTALGALDVTVVRCRLEKRATAVTKEHVGSALFEEYRSLPYAEYVRRCRDADVVVIAADSSDKPVGLTALLECMALGRPIVVTEGMSSRDYVEDGRTALTYRQGDAQHLREQVERLLANSELAATLGAAARRAASGRLGLDECGNEMAELIREAAAR